MERSGRGRWRDREGGEGGKEGVEVLGWWRLGG